jgi:NAD(P)-dependent dehydrogenase (short-subunit alcohol dehydrogenase family)
MARILITGASTGIGRATVTELARRGHDVVATARRPATLAGLPAAERLALDVTDQASVDAAVSAAGDIDALVSNAGETVRGSVEATPLGEYQRLYDINFLGALRVTKAVLPAFRARGGGRLIYVSSVLGRGVIPLISGYAASKFALEALAETLAIEVAPLGVHVTTIQPGQVATPGPGKASVWNDDHEAYAPIWQAVSRMGSGDRIQPEEVARAIAETVENPDPPLRLPVGKAAIRQLEARRAAPDDEPFSYLTVG